MGTPNDDESAAARFDAVVMAAQVLGAERDALLVKVEELERRLEAVSRAARVLEDERESLLARIAQLEGRAAPPAA